jgi:hypothetical protein
MGCMSDFRKQLGYILHHGALKLASLDSGTVVGFYMAPGAFGLMVAKSRLFGITDDFALSLALASFVYMSMPALCLLIFNFATGGARFRLQVGLIVIAIIVLSVGIAFWMAYLVPMPPPK